MILLSGRVDVSLGGRSERALTLSEGTYWLGSASLGSIGGIARGTRSPRNNTCPTCCLALPNGEKFVGVTLRYRDSGTNRICRDVANGDTMNTLEELTVIVSVEKGLSGGVDTHHTRAVRAGR